MPCKWTLPSMTDGLPRSEHGDKTGPVIDWALRQREGRPYRNQIVNLQAQYRCCHCHCHCFLFAARVTEFRCRDTPLAIISATIYFRVGPNIHYACTRSTCQRPMWTCRDTGQSSVDIKLWARLAFDEDL